jgi:hypothetical protein
LKRAIEKKRKRHLLIAYELFSRRKDKIMAFTEYAKKKLELKMIRKGGIWRKRNMQMIGP